MNTTFTTLISATQLRALLDAGEAPILIDARFDLADTAAGERAWGEGHLPGAIWIDLDAHLAAHDLPDLEVNRRLFPGLRTAQAVDTRDRGHN